jgi:hypothetical protein
VQQYRTQAEGEAKQFSGIAERNRITPEDIMRPLEDMPELRPAAEALPEGVDEEDIQETMRAHGLTREQVLERLNARP